MIYQNSSQGLVFGSYKNAMVELDCRWVLENVSPPFV